MPPIVRNILAVIAGVFVGSCINMAIVMLGPMVIPVPEGVDMSDMEKFASNLTKLKPVNFIPPFLAHALGTLVGAFVAAKLAASWNRALALGIGAWFLLGGITVVAMYGGPLWFQVSDLLLAYIPMGLLGGWLGTRSTASANSAV